MSISKHLTLQRVVVITKIEYGLNKLLGDMINVYQLLEFKMCQNIWTICTIHKDEMFCKHQHIPTIMESFHVSLYNQLQGINNYTF